jgi:hypothetical protein
MNKGPHKYFNSTSGEMTDIITWTFGSSQNDPVGAILQTQNLDPEGGFLTIDSEGHYTGNSIADAQIMVAYAKQQGEANNWDWSDSLDLRRNSISEMSVKWAFGEQDTVDGGILTLNSKYPELPTYRLGSYEFNGDSMFHVNKGVIGFKLDACYNCVCKNCRVSRMGATGLQGFIHKTLPLPMYTDVDDSHVVVNRDLEYQNKAGKSHQAATYPGYNGAAARGFSLASSKNVYLEDCSVEQASSRHGTFYGFDMHRHTENIYITGNTKVHRTYAGNQGCFGANRNVELQTCRMCAIRKGGLATGTTQVDSWTWDQRTWELAWYRTNNGRSNKAATKSSYVNRQKLNEILTGLHPDSFNNKVLVAYDSSKKVVACAPLARYEDKHDGNGFQLVETAITLPPTDRRLDLSEDPELDLKKRQEELMVLHSGSVAGSL